MNVQTLKQSMKTLIHKKGEVVIVFAFMVILMMVCTILNPRFMTFRNIYSLIKSFLPLLIITFGQCLVMTTTAGVDMSVGGVVALTNCVLAVYMRSGFFGWFLPFVGVLAMGVVIGLINGVLVAKGRLQPLIVTLAVNVALGGLALVVLPRPDPALNGTMNKDFLGFLSGGLNGYFPLVLFIAITVIVWLFLNKTKTGRSCTAVGGNEFSAVCSNINVDRMKITVFVVSGLLGALSGTYLTGQMYSGDPTVGTQMVTQTITAAAVGGTSLAGGKGSIVGCVIGVFVVYIINNILNLTGVSFYYQYLVQGILLVAALALAAFRKKRKNVS